MRIERNRLRSAVQLEASAEQKPVGCRDQIGRARHLQHADRLSVHGLRPRPDQQLRDRPVRDEPRHAREVPVVRVQARHPAVVLHADQHDAAVRIGERDRRADQIAVRQAL